MRDWIINQQAAGKHDETDQSGSSIRRQWRFYRSRWLSLRRRSTSSQSIADQTDRRPAAAEQNCCSSISSHNSPPSALSSLPINPSISHMTHTHTHSAVQSNIMISWCYSVYVLLCPSDRLRPLWGGRNASSSPFPSWQTHTCTVWVTHWAKNVCVWMCKARTHAHYIADAVHIQLQYFSHDALQRDRWAIRCSSSGSSSVSISLLRPQREGDPSTLDLLRASRSDMGVGEGWVEPLETF